MHTKKPLLLGCNGGLPPRLDSKEYIERTAMYMSRFSSFYNTGKCSLIIGGPKDSGKTNRIDFLRAAKDVGYHVIELNLKGLIDVKSALDTFSWEFLEGINDMNDEDISCSYEKILHCPAIKRSWGLFFDKVITLCTTIGMAAIGYLFQRKLYSM